MGVFLAAKSKEGHTIQYFQAPTMGTWNTVAIIAAVAVQIGDDIITFTPTGDDYAERQVMRIRVNGREASYGVATSLKDGYVTAAARTAFRYGASQPICVGDHRRTFTVTMEADPNKFHEINWAIMMDDGVIDGAAPSTCHLGPTSWNQQTNINKDKVEDMRNVLFSAHEIQEMCRVGWKGLGGTCDLDTTKGICPWNNKMLCDALGSSFHAKAQAACSGLDVKFREFCVFQYCNDLGKGNFARAAMQHEGGVEAQQREVMASHIGR